MTKIIEIEQCEDCLYESSGCTLQEDGEIKDIPDKHDIPEWCPLDSLEDYIENEIKHSNYTL